MHEGQRKCGAKTRSGPVKGAPCKDIAMANGRCKRHGGKCTGAKNPNVALAEANPAYTHGIYTKFFREDEKALLDQGAFRLGQVDTELAVMRVRLKRTLEAKEQWEAEVRGDIDGANEETATVLVETVDGEAPGPEGSTIPISKKTRRLPDFDKIIDSTAARIESLEKTRKELLKTDDGGEGDGTNRLIIDIRGGLPTK